MLSIDVLTPVRSDTSFKVMPIAWRRARILEPTRWMVVLDPTGSAGSVDRTLAADAPERGARLLGFLTMVS
jgi:hypothetical protein